MRMFGKEQLGRRIGGEGKKNVEGGKKKRTNLGGKKRIRTVGDGKGGGKVVCVRKRKRGTLRENVQAQRVRERKIRVAGKSRPVGKVFARNEKEELKVGELLWTKFRVWGGQLEVEGVGQRHSKPGTVAAAQARKGTPG